MMHRWLEERVQRAVAAGKHMFCEKPIALNAPRAREMRAASQAAGSLAHFVPMSTRWSPAFVQAREIVRRGAFGEVNVVNYRWPCAGFRARIAGA